MSNELITYTPNPQATLVDIRKDNARFPRLHSYPQDVAHTMMMAVVLKANELFGTKAEMAEVSRRFEEILTGVTDKRMQVILRSYYAVGMTDDSIGELLGLTTRRINALRNSFLRTLEVPEAA